MKSSVLSGIVLMSAATAVAQTTPSPTTRTTPPTAVIQTITLTGCVSGGTNSQPFTLTNAMVIPAAPQPGSTTASVSSASSIATQPPPATSAQPPATAAPIPAPAAQPPSAAGTTGAAGATTAGATGTAGAVGTAGTAGAVGGTAPPGLAAATSASAMNGYRLSGADMSSWTGRRVQIVGTVVPPASSTAGVAASTGTSGAASAAPMPEFRVQSIQPTNGPCPQH
jgi:hypothetical protein